MTNRILILLPANNLAGTQKVGADLAYSFFLKGFEVTLSYPLIPYLYFFLSIKDYKGFIKNALKYILDYLKDSRFKMHEILFDTNVKVKPFLLRPSLNFLRQFDEILVLGEYLLIDIIKDPSLAEKSSLYVFHPTELVHKNPGFVRPIYRKFLESSRKVFSLSEFTQTWLKKNLNLNSEILFPVLSRFYWPIEKNEDPKSSDILIYYIPTHNKGSELAVSLMNFLEESLPDVKIAVLLFSGISKRQKKVLKAKFPKIEFLQNIKEKDMPVLYKRFKLFYYPSRFEGFGIPPLEALACNTLPIVNEGVGGYSSFYNGENLLFIDRDNLEVTFTAIKTLLLDSNKFTEYKDKLSRTDFDKFDPSRYSESYMDKKNILES